LQGEPAIATLARFNEPRLLEHDLHAFEVAGPPSGPRCWNVFFSSRSFGSLNSSFDSVYERKTDTAIFFGFPSRACALITIIGI
jgi:hypothetical protein